jgi:hypothetical protein
MKKVILIFLAAIAFSCGDGSNRSSESTGNESQTEDNYSGDAVESDTTDMQSDTTSTPGMDRQGGVDTTSNRSNNP